MISVKSHTLRLLLLILFALSVNEILFADEAVFKKNFENGLLLLVKESPPKNLVSINVSVKAAPIYEEEYTGSGISHFVEHMLFKGTGTRKPQDIEKEVRSYGGIIDGSVSSDVADYSITVPCEYFPNALAILKDMLLNASFDKVELEKEREVILKEIRLNQDDPEKRLVVSLFSNSYIRHNYKYPVIGFEGPLKALTREDLVKYYNRRYVPNNIVIAVAGGISAKDAVSCIEKEFKDFRNCNYAPANEGKREPVQIGKRLVEEEAPITLSYLALGFHSTSILDNDLFSLDVLSIILGRGDNSRLNNVLVKEARKAYSVSASNYTPQDPGLFIISAFLDKENIGEVKRLILEQIKKIKDGEIDDSQIETAKRMVLNDYILSRETIEEQAKDLAENQILAGNSDFSRRYVDGVGAVTKSSVRKAANQYLNEDNMTEVRLVPKDTGTLAGMSIPKVPVETKFEKKVLPNGLTVLLRKSDKIPAASITVAFKGGLLAENKDTNGISNLTAHMFLKGTKKRNEAQIKGAIESLGGEINSFSGLDSFGLSATVMKNDVGFALDLIKDVVTDSTFPQEEIEKEKLIIYATIKDENDDIFRKGTLAIRKNIFGGYPYGMRVIGEENTIHALTFDDLMKFYQKYCVVNNMVVSVSGDIEPAKVYEKIDALFRDIPRKEISKQSLKVPELDKVATQAIRLDKEQSLLLIGFKTVAINDSEKYPLEVLDAVFSGMGGRLFGSLRDKLGLAYALGCEQRLGLGAGFMVFYVATTKEEIDESKKLLLDEIKLVRESDIKDEELNSAKKEMIVSHAISMQSNSFNCFQGALDELCGIGYDSIYKYEDEIKKVKKEDIKRVADKYLDLNKYAEVIIQPD